MSLFKLTAGLFLFSVFTSCSFNGVFLHPEYDPGNEQITYNLEGNGVISITSDTIVRQVVMKDYSFTSKSTNKLSAWLISPETDYNGVTILFCHGNAGSVKTTYSSVMPLVENGFEIFLFDYSGFGESEGKATRKNVKTDALSALEQLIKIGNKNRSKLIVYGQSLGGHLTAALSSEIENDIDAVVIEGAFSSHKDIGRAVAGLAGRILVAERYSGRKSLAKFNKPVLIIHSKQDKTIPFRMGETLFNSANEPKEFLEINGYHIQGPTLHTDSIVSRIRLLLN